MCARAASRRQVGVQGVKVGSLAQRVRQAVAALTAVPSAHSLNVVTSWSGSPDAAMARTSDAHRARSRASLGADSLYLQNPGLIA